ncbi:MAG TPA: sensor histidine kinase [Candidatus Limnocylindrales bacterium]|nr:sensor histidine kinase [Candidatus Limnocylindrales bacterium]
MEGRVGSGSLADRASVVDPGAQPEESGGSRADEPVDAAGRRWFDAVLAGEIAILAILTLLALLPAVRLVASNGSLDVVLNTLTAVAAAGAAALAWIRFRIDRDVAAIHESSAFLMLCVTRVLIVGIAAFGNPEELGMSLDRPQQWPLYAWSLARFASAVLLVVAASSSFQRRRETRLPALLGLGPVIAVLVLFVVLHAMEASLPALMGPAGLAALRGDPAASAGMEPAGLAIQIVVGGTYFIGALLYRRLYREHGRRYAGYLALALVVAGFSQFHWATFPGIYRPLVTVDDVLRALFSVILLLGIEAQFRGDLRALRAANSRLEALRRRDAERAATEASARLAREVHDGLSQDLWLAKLAQARLASTQGLPGDVEPLVVELGGAIDRALGDARSVVASLRSAPGVVGLGDQLQQTAGEFEAQTGIRAEVGGLASLSAVSDPVAAEILQIVREALANVRKHADATLVRVSASTDGDGVEVVVTDNGRGFEPAQAGRATFGLRGMRERAALVGGTIRIESRPADGTRVVLRAPTQPSGRIGAPA